MQASIQFTPSSHCSRRAGRCAAAPMQWSCPRYSTSSRSCDDQLHRSIATTPRRCRHANDTRRRASLTTAPTALHEEAASGKVGIVIVDHGSRKAESNMQLFEFASLFKQLTGAPVVECAHMEIAEPSIEHAIGRCVAQGVQSVVVAPYFLSRGRHIQEDIPHLVKEAQAKFNGVRCVVAEPIGVDALMAQLICNRVNAAVDVGCS